jgi:hypothetical protein
MCGGHPLLTTAANTFPDKAGIVMSPMGSTELDAPQEDQLHEGCQLHTCRARSLPLD